MCELVLLPLQPLVPLVVVVVLLLMLLLLQTRMNLGRSFMLRQASPFSVGDQVCHC